MDADKLASEVSKYLETHAALSMPGAIPETPQGKKEKGSSRAPASGAFEMFIEANQIPFRYIDWRVTELRRSGNAYGGVRFAAIIGRLYDEPASVAQWENRGTKRDRADHAAWRKMCRLVADSILAAHPDVFLHIHTNPKDAPLVKRDAKHVYRRWRAEDAKRLRYERLQAIEQRENCTRTLAVEKLAKEMKCGKSTIWESVEFCKEVNAS